MNFRHIRYILFGAALTACSSEGIFVEPEYTVGEEDNAIVLSAGVYDGHGVASRADEPVPSKVYTAFSDETQLRLWIGGNWKKSAETDPVAVTKPTTATTAATATIDTDTDGENDTHTVTFSDSEKCYWDDYGTADPANATAGRTEGLTIYGVAIDGKQTAPAVPNATDWEALSWALNRDQTTTGWADKDLLTSNNISATGDGTYKFDDWKNNTSPSNLLKFTHAMSKVTVVLHAGAGFPSKFEQNPTVTLKNFYYTGNVNVKTKTSTATTTALGDIKMHLDNGGENSPTASFTALVFPGNGWEEATKGNTILTLSADGNDYSVTAEKLLEALTANSQTALTQGYNYILDLTVNKTAVDVTATIVDWKEIKAQNEAPIISVNKSYGYEGKKFTDSFTFMRSTSIVGDYLVGYADHTNQAQVTYSAEKYTMSPQLYWPNHSIHYFFRGVYPEIGSTDSNDDKMGPATSDFNDGKSVNVVNEAYNQYHYPSDLMIGFPRKADGTSDEICKREPLHKDADETMKGICATSGDIRMNFEYAMSQVIVKLETSAPDRRDHVTFDANTKVEIVNGYTNGVIKLEDGKSDFTGKTPATYTMPLAASHESNTKYHAAMIPQSLTSSAGDLKFKITVMDTSTGESSNDSYETVLGIKDIEVQEQISAGTWGDKKKITEWEPGKIYTYTLRITKTGIIVIATIKNWIPVQASTNVWL